MLMSLRAAIVGLIVLATVGFVVGTTIERNSKESHAETPAAARSEGSSESHAEGGESEAKRAAESGSQGESAHAGEGAQAGGEAAHREYQPFGVNIEAVPFIVLAALVSLGLAAAVWTRPGSLLVLGVVAAAMVLFAALDVREVFHQVDESRTGLAVLAGVVAALHLAAAAAIGLLARGDGRLTGTAGTMPA
jgi:hypothetical protein